MTRRVVERVNIKPFGFHGMGVFIDRRGRCIVHLQRGGGDGGRQGHLVARHQRVTLRKLRRFIPGRSRRVVRGAEDTVQRTIGGRCVHNGLHADVRTGCGFAEHGAGQRRGLPTDTRRPMLCMTSRIVGMVKHGSQRQDGIECPPFSVGNSRHPWNPVGTHHSRARPVGACHQDLQSSGHRHAPNVTGQAELALLDVAPVLLRLCR
ncbi:hypothetical protein D3C76_1022290 [compost metagenome]